MAIIQPDLNQFLANRLTGADGFYDSFQLDIRTSTPPRFWTSPMPGTLLWSQALGSMWATWNGAGTINMNSPTASQVLTAGTASGWELSAEHDSARIPLLRGKVSVLGGGESIQFANLLWAQGATVSVDSLALQLTPTS